MKHDFTGQLTTQLLILKGCMLGTLQNKHCEIVTTPVSNTIRQIDRELRSRGIQPIKTNYMDSVKIEQGIETYKRTIKDEPRQAWANWVLAIHNSLAAGEWIGEEMFPEWVELAYYQIKAEKTVSMSDSN